MTRSAVLLCLPTYFEVRDRKNPYTRAAVDHDKAQRQWEELRLAFREAGLQVETIDCRASARCRATVPVTQPNCGEFRAYVES